MIFFRKLFFAIKSKGKKRFNFSDKPVNGEQIFHSFYKTESLIVYKVGGNRSLINISNLFNAESIKIQISPNFNEFIRL